MVHHLREWNIQFGYGTISQIPFESASPKDEAVSITVFASERTLSDILVFIEENRINQRFPKCDGRVEVRKPEAIYVHFTV